jgi:ubiquinone/menaquinone biosynthesis C-methylase UbiE
VGLDRLLFDGPLGLVTARIMAGRNTDTEREAIETLAPAPEHTVLAVGFGAGTGVAELASRVAAVGGVDPSWAMVTVARRRNRSGRVRLERRTADRIPWPDNSFDGALAVNSIQLWRPLAASVAEVARVLRPGARLVTFTHDWVVARGDGETLDDWLAGTTAALAAGGFTDVGHWRATAERGRSVVLAARAT